MICRRCDLPKAAHTQGPLGLVCPRQIFTFAPKEEQPLAQPGLSESVTLGAFVGGAVAGAALTFGARAAAREKAEKAEKPKALTPRQKRLAKNKQRSRR